MRSQPFPDNCWPVRSLLKLALKSSTVTSLWTTQRLRWMCHPWNESRGKFDSVAANSTLVYWEILQLGVKREQLGLLPLVQDLVQWIRTRKGP